MGTMTDRYDDAVIGAGIIGLAHAYHLARRGRRVAVFERSPRAQGASVRNFGMLWPIGQPPGPMLKLALRSRELWLEVIRAVGLWHDPVGSLHLAYHDDEATVLQEFARESAGHGYSAAWLAPAEVCQRSRYVRPDGLKGAMWSSTEICVDPRAVVAGLPAFLTNSYGVEFHFQCAAHSYDHPVLQAGGRSFTAERLWVCTGDDLQTLYPETFGSAGLVRCKLQMMRTPPCAWRLGPMLAAGLTLRHYRSFAHCPSLPALRDRFARDYPRHERYGIHVMVSQNGLGELVIGDSHEYGDAIEPFDKAEIDTLILDYLRDFFDVPQLTIAARWHGIYAKHPTEPFLVLCPARGTVATIGVGGMGMTLSFGLAEQVIESHLR
jgi:FAD dependent oxidoreductase TIGR03364